MVRPRLLIPANGTVTKMPSNETGLSVQQFPKFAPGQNRYRISQKDANLNIEHLHIPSGYVISVEPGVSEIDWSVKKISFGEKSMIDLSSTGSVPQKPAPAPDRPGQAEHGKVGGWGSDGHTGVSGRNGVSLTIRNLVAIENGGSLWICTNGQSGGEGGDGGAGGMGGGPRNPGIPIFGKKSARGGYGGRGGAGGKGGNTSTVKIRYLTTGLGGRFVSGCADRPVDLNGPPSWNDGDTGVIAIYGGPGLGGNGGRGGRGGYGGDRDAPQGPAGEQGSTGVTGECISVETTFGT